MTTPADLTVPDLTVVVLTRDEARHIERCIASVRDIAARIVVIDSGSTDGTRDLARAAGAHVLENPWVNYATQFNWALDHAGITTGWTLRIDADEVVLPELATSIRAFISGDLVTDGATANRRIYFMGRWIRRGGVYPIPQLRLFRTGRGRCENRWMDEHMLVAGPIAHLAGDFADINLNSIGWWTAKHNLYATREAVDALLADAGAADAGLARHARAKRWVKHNVYARLPLGVRALLYFLYRYIVLFGVLEGRAGLVFFALQSGWYRFLVDVKIAELRGLMATRGQSLAEVVRDEYGLKL